MGTTLDQVLAKTGTEPDLITFEAITDRIKQRLSDVPFSSLTPTEQKLYAIIDLNDNIPMDGFDGYFLNPCGDHALIALEALKELGLKEKAAILSDAMSAFPDGKIPADGTEREKIHAQISKSSVGLWNKCDDRFYALKDDESSILVKYVKDHRADIKVP
jgi:hypothetical protein